MLAPMRPTPTNPIFFGLGRFGDFFFAAFVGIVGSGLLNEKKGVANIATTPSFL